MKKLFLFAIGFYFAIIQLFAQHTDIICNHQPSQEIANAGAFSEFGYCHTPQGNLHFLMLYVTFIEDDANPNIPDVLSSVWPKNNLPNYIPLNNVAGPLIDTDKNNPSTLNNLTNWFKTMSKVNNNGVINSKFSITGEAFHVQISKDISGIPVDPTKEVAMKSYERVFCQRAIAALNAKYPNENWSRFDLRQNNPQWGYNNNEQKADGTPAGGDGYIDYLNINFRNTRNYVETVGQSGNAGIAEIDLFSNKDDYPLQAITNATGSYLFNVGHVTTYAMDLNFFFQFFLHEFSHNLFNSSHYMGANSSPGQLFYVSNGWGIMGNMERTFLTANAWEKWFLGWAQPQLITKQNINPTGIYVVKDFTDGLDALQIELPYHRFYNESSKNHTFKQYLYIENHQKTNHFDKKFLILATTDQTVPGLYAYISYADDKTKINSTTMENNRLKTLSAAGNFDYILTNYVDRYNASFSIGNANPISGQNSIQCIRGDFDANGKISVAFEGEINNEHTRAIEINGINRHYSTVVNFDAFQVGDELSLSTNNPIVGLTNFTGLNSSQNSSSYTGPIRQELNSISVKVLSYNPTTKEYTIQVSFYDVEIKENTRWTGSRLILRNLSDDVNPDIIIKPNVTLTINRTGTPNTIWRALNNEYPEFNQATNFTVKDNAHILVEENAHIVVDDKTEWNFESGTKITIKNNASVTLKNSSILKLLGNASIEIEGTGRLVFESGSMLMYNTNGIINLKSSASHIELKQNAKIEVAKDATFTWLGPGYLKINTPTRGVSNIVASGTNAKFYKKGSGAQFSQKIIEITNGSLSIDKSLTHFKIELGNVVMGHGTLLDVESKMQCHSIKFSTFNPNQKHDGIMVYGQQETPYLTGCVVENASWGFMAYNNSGGAQKAALYDCKFINNGLGVYINGKGADISYCKFWQNTTGAIHLDMMTLSTNITNTDAYDNGNNALLVTGTNNSIVNVNKCNMYFNKGNGITTTNTTLAIGCSKIFNNYSLIASNNNNVQLNNHSVFAQEPALWPSVGNSYYFNSLNDGIITNNARRLYLNNAKNHFQVNNGWEFKGTMRRPFLGRYRNVIANQNYWNISGTTPLNRNEYWITYKSSGNNNLDLMINDGNPLTNAPTFDNCGTNGSGSFPGDNGAETKSVFIGKPSTQLADGRVIEAVFSLALKQMYNDNLPKLAIQNFIDISLHNYSTEPNILLGDGTYISEFELWSDVIDLSYQKALESLTRGIESGLIAAYPNDVEVYNAIENLQLQLINKTSTEPFNDYEWSFGIKLDRGILYHVTNRNQDALTILNTVKALDNHTAINLNLLNFTICNLEKLIAMGDGSISKKDLRAQLKNCSNLIDTISDLEDLTVNTDEPEDPPYSTLLGKRNTNPIPQPETQDNTDLTQDDFVGLYPNPNNGVFYITANVNIIDVEVFDLLGKKVSHQFNGNTIQIQSKGIYIISIKTNKQITRKRIIVQ